MDNDYKKTTFYIPQDIIERTASNKLLEGLVVTWAGCYTKAYGHIVSNRIISDYVLIYCVDGQGWLKLEDRYFTVNAGDIFVCPPHKVHNYGADEENPWTKYWLHFRGSNAAEYMQLLDFSNSAPIKSIGMNIRIVSWIQDIFDILKKGYTQSNMLFATSYLANIFSYINSLSLTVSDSLDIEKVISYMLNNIDRTLTLTQLSDYAKLSRYHFVRVFKERTGYTPMDYYVRLKIQKACELLASPDIKINAISSALAFSSPYYFSTVFKKITGKSPEKYRHII